VIIAEERAVLNGFVFMNPKNVFALMRWKMLLLPKSVIAGMTGGENA
jgi:hypothetical protein